MIPTTRPGACKDEDGGEADATVGKLLHTLRPPPPPPQPPPTERGSTLRWTALCVVFFLVPYVLVITLLVVGDAVWGCPDGSTSSECGHRFNGSTPIFRTTWQRVFAALRGESMQGAGFNLGGLVEQWAQQVPLPDTYQPDDTYDS